MGGQIRNYFTPKLKTEYVGLLNFKPLLPKKIY
jgi:hypothetical protein